jgi:hypothetical protein
VDEEDLLKIEFIFCGPLVPNPIAKQVVTEGIGLSSLEKLLKTYKLQLDWFTPTTFHIGKFENSSYFGWMNSIS